MRSLGGALPLELMARDELDLIVRDVALRTGALTGLLVVRNAMENHIDVVCACGTVPSQDRLSLPVRRSGFVGRVLASGGTVGEPLTSERNSLLRAATRDASVTYAAGAPVRPPGGPPGALCVGLASKPPDPATTLWVVESYARLASLCLHDAGALGGLLAAGRRDGLTGCLSYAAIRSELEREIGRCARHGRVVACCFIDLDRFKQVNDRYGHPHGSRVLAEVASALRAGVRIGDSVGRYGGDEFIVLLPDTDRDAAHALAERLRGAICRTNVAGGHEPLDASIGIAHWRAGMSADGILAAADEALRGAKRAGGGTVVGAGDVAAGAGRGDAAPGERDIRSRREPPGPADPRSEQAVA
jgi:diguanylate cyclase (GGDEF)-like protein